MAETWKSLVGSLAVVLPRYGESLGGGAEALVRALVQELSFENKTVPSLVERIEVWTTCALDHRTWENAFPAGRTEEHGVPVFRFPVDRRDVSIFLEQEQSIADGKALTVDQQLAWLENSVNSRALYQHIFDNGPKFDAILFAPYLFATTFWGAMIYPEKSIIIPCLHNEAYAYQPVFQALFSAVRGLIFNSIPERDLALDLYNIPQLESKSAVVGMGFVDSRRGTAEENLTNLNLGHVSVKTLPAGPYLLYSGRKERGKNLDLLLSYFDAFRKDCPDQGVSLVLIGSGEIHFCNELPKGVIDLGFVSEVEKEALMRGALALVQPSTNESFSIVIMESWLRETPVVVHADCAVTRHHVTTSGGGLYFSNQEEFSAVVKELLSNGSLRTLLGHQGKRYVEDTYCWPAVIGRLYRAFDKFGFGEERKVERSEERSEERSLEGPSAVVHDA